jgi:hypothetical protein
VMTPSKKLPMAQSLLSPPIPSRMAPCFRMGWYPGGRGPSYSVAPACTAQSEPPHNAPLL